MFKEYIEDVLMEKSDDGGSGSGNNSENDQTNGDDNGEPNETDNSEGGTSEQETLKIEDVKKMIQSETDKIRTEYSKKLKQKDSELEKAKKEKMTDAERKEYELNQMKDDLTKREKELLDKEMSLKTIDLLKDNELPLEARDFVKGQDEESTKSNVEAFKDMFNQAVEMAVQNKFKLSGKHHKSGDDNSKTYTQEMLKDMSAKEINDNWDKIQKDLSK